MVSVLRANVLIEEVHDGLLLRIVYYSKDIMRHFLEVVH